MYNVYIYTYIYIYICVYIYIIDRERERKNKRDIYKCGRTGPPCPGDTCRPRLVNSS